MLRLLLSSPLYGCARPSAPSLAAPTEGAADAPATLIVHRADVRTLDGSAPGATAIAVRDGVILELGDDALLERWRGADTRVLDLAGGTVTPGLVDAHAHLVGLGDSLQSVDLRGATSMDDVVERLKAGAPPSGWVRGRGWDQNLWPGATMPSHNPITQAFPDRPVWLKRIDGHAAWGNAALMRAAGIRADTPDPEGGEILRDGSGAATGVFIDAAMDLVHAPPPTADDVRHWLLTAQEHILARGLTGVHEMGIGPLEDQVYRALASDTDGLRVRVHAYAAEGWFVRDLLDQAPDPIRADARYTLAGVKVYADGALGSRGAALLAPYADRHDHTGLMQHDIPGLRRVVKQAMRGGWQVATHAIGDAANRAVLDAYEAGLPYAARTDPRPRVEHCQIVDPVDIVRFADLGVIASMQPTHATSDMPWAAERLGTDRLAGAYAWQRYLEAGAHLAFGSDFPVELADVTHGLYAAVTRQDAAGQPSGGWLPDQRVSLEQALRSFSYEAAYAAHREAHVGRLAPGYRADLTCFAAPLDEANPAALREAAVRGTVVDGVVAYWAD